MTCYPSIYTMGHTDFLSWCFMENSIGLKRFNYFPESVDVNVTPDKRQVFLEGEKMILAVVKVKYYQFILSVFCRL